MTARLHGAPVGRVVIVTGGSRGMGRAMVRALANRSYVVVVNYAHDQQAAESTVETVLADGGDAVTVRADVADDLDVQRLFIETIAAFGGIDAVVHTVCARLATTRAKLIFNREAARHLRQGGAIVHLSSSTNSPSAPADDLSAATRAPTDALTRALALEFRARDITVNTVSLEVNSTGAHSRAADVVAYLLSADGHGLTGQVLRLDDPRLQPARSAGGNSGQYP